MNELSVVLLGGGIFFLGKRLASCCNQLYICDIITKQTSPQNLKTLPLDFPSRQEQLTKTFETVFIFDFKITIKFCCFKN